jgi:hypothetical protein
VLIPKRLLSSSRKEELTCEDGVSDYLLMEIPLYSLKKAVDYTAYPEGSPMHPS